MSRLFSAALLIGFGGANCVSAEEPATPTHPYFPLKLGAEWTYRVPGTKDPITVKVAGIERVGGNFAFRLETTAAGPVPATELVQVTKEGVLRTLLNGLPANPPILFLKGDGKAGDKWDVDSRVAGTAVKGTFTTSREKVTVPGGTFDAVRVSGTDVVIGAMKGGVDYWFAKDTGIVKFRHTLGAQEAVLELEEYKPGK
jgi:hypothetical protein